MSDLSSFQKSQVKRVQKLLGVSEDWVIDVALKYGFNHIAEAVREHINE
jgi:hypothetical protein